MSYDVIIGLNVLMKGVTIINENGVRIKNKSKCTEEVTTLSILPINLSPDDFENNIAPDIPQIYQSKVKTIAPNFDPGKKDGLHEGDDQRTVTLSPVVRVAVELQHASNLPKLKDGLKHLAKPDPIIQSVIEETGEHIVAGTEELHLENCFKDLEENNACISLNNTDPVVVVPEGMPKENKRSAHEKRYSRIKENKDYYFIPKLKQKIEKSIVNYDHRVLMNHKRRKKEGFLHPFQIEDVPLKTYRSDHLGPHRIIKLKEGVMERFVQLAQDFQQ
ncbi:elongation factor 2 [Trichonephila clavata]|uniref:Elongation factor 2 n=1 Tax=Trichonephila clavata TaxID=2740835 RepID=A0A8X6LW22_TRICU|nr:elongation factor 2 [Trichonephila clavata]